MRRVFSEVMCAFTMHEWKLTKRGAFYNFFTCKVCGAERIEPIDGVDVLKP